MPKRSDPSTAALLDADNFNHFDQFVQQFSGTVGGLTNAQRLIAANLLIDEINDDSNHKRGNKIGDEHEGLHEESLLQIYNKITDKSGEYAFLRSSGCCSCLYTLFNSTGGAAYNRVLQTLQQRAIVLFQNRHMKHGKYIEATIERGSAARGAPNLFVGAYRAGQRALHDSTVGVPLNSPYDMLMNMVPIMEVDTSSAAYTTYQEHIGSVNKTNPSWALAYHQRHASAFGRADSRLTVEGARF